MLPPSRTGKQGRTVLLAQQCWEIPPLSSRHTVCVGFTGSGIEELQASPVQVSSHTDSPQSSGIGGIPLSSAVFGHGIGPNSVALVPVVIGLQSIESVEPGGQLGGQSSDRS